MRYRWTHEKWELMVADQWFKVYQTDCAIGEVNYVLYPKSTFYLQELSYGSRTVCQQWMQGSCMWKKLRLHVWKPHNVP